MNDLRATIMNLLMKNPYRHGTGERKAYAVGCRDMRHQAAEAALPLLEQCRALEALLREINDAGYIKAKHTADDGNLEERISALLAQIKKEDA